MKKAISIAVSIICISKAACGVGFLVTPPRAEHMLAGGQTQTYNLSVVNHDSVYPVKLKAFVMDWLMKTNGQLYTPKPGTKLQSCSDWIEINPTEFEVPPNTEQTIRYTVKVPDSSFGSNWCILYFESQPDTTQSAMVGIIMKAQIGIPIYVTIPGTVVIQAELLNFTYKRKGFQSHEFKLQVKNTGNVHLRTKGTLAIKDGGGTTVATLSLNDEVILPQSQRDLVLPLKQELVPGRYTAVINLDCGTPELIQGETAFEVVK
jgi:P pilus assembly chaperone PapD